MTCSTRRKYRTRRHAARRSEKPVISEAQNPNSGRRPEFAKIFGSEAPKKGKNGPVGRGDTGAGRGFVSWGLPGPDPAALKGATGRIGKIPTYVKRSRALKSARSFSPKFRAGRRRVSPTPSPTSTNPANVCLTRPGAPAPPLEPFLGVRISEHPKSRTCIEKPVINLCECAALQPLGRRPPSSGVDNRSDVEIFPIARRYRVSCTPVCVTKVE